MDKAIQNFTKILDFCISSYKVINDKYFEIIFENPYVKFINIHILIPIFEKIHFSEKKIDMLSNIYDYIHSELTHFFLKNGKMSLIDSKKASDNLLYVFNTFIKKKSPKIFNTFIKKKSPKIFNELTKIKKIKKINDYYNKIITYNEKNDYTITNIMQTKNGYKFITNITDEINKIINDYDINLIDWSAPMNISNGKYKIIFDTQDINFIKSMVIINNSFKKLKQLTSTNTLPAVEIKNLLEIEQKKFNDICNKIVVKITENNDSLNNIFNDYVSDYFQKETYTIGKVFSKPKPHEVSQYYVGGEIAGGGTPSNWSIVVPIMTYNYQSTNGNFGYGGGGFSCTIL